MPFWRWNFTLSDVSTIINSGFERVIINSKSNTDYNFTENYQKVWNINSYRIY